MSDVPADELARCALVNLDNLADALPFLKQHIYFVITRQQLQAAIAAFEWAER